MAYCWWYEADESYRYKLMCRVALSRPTGSQAQALAGTSLTKESRQDTADALDCPNA